MWDKEGDIVWDAWIIIYPGENGDPWWAIFQLIAQVKSAIEIFDPAHPGCQALFIFDQSSAHASLPPDALQAFDMNKSDGGEQQIPLSWSQTQTLTIMAKLGQWPHRMVKQKVLKLCLLSVDSIWKV